MNAKPPDNQPLEEARAILAEMLERLRGVDDAERAMLAEEIDRIEALARRLAEGRIEVAIFGEIDTGKSALINALVGQDVSEVNVRGGWTRERIDALWDRPGFEVQGLPGATVTLVDTPGINEIDGQTRARLAREAASRADVILFVTDSDLTELEYRALVDLLDQGRPVLIVFNKADLYPPAQRAEIRRALEERLAGLAPPGDIVETAAAPRAVLRVIEQADGSEREEQHQPPPDVDALRARLAAVLEREGARLAALSTVQASEAAGQRLAQVRMQIRRLAAQRIIWANAGVKMAAVALNPVPVIDAAAGVSVDVAMVLQLARLYDLRMTRTSAFKLVAGIVGAAGGVAAIEWGVHAAAATFKLLTLGVGSLISAGVQGPVAGYASYRIGQAACYYFEHDASWGGRSPRQVMRMILDADDRDAIMRQLRDQLRRRRARTAAASNDRATD